MRSLLKPTRSLTSKHATTQRVLFSNSYVSRLPRRDSTAPVRPTSRTHKRASSSASPVASNAPIDRIETLGGPVAPSGSVPPEEPDEGSSEKEKTRRVRRTRAEIEDDNPSVSLPPNLDILWTPESIGMVSASALPSPEILQEVLTDFLITLHPQTQHRSVYPSSTGSTVEPTLALYCPIEGGDYVIDETVKELARKTNSDVVVLDSVQLAGGEWGSFGKAAEALNLPKNPLHFRPPAPTVFSRTDRQPGPEQDHDEDEDDFDHSNFIPASMSVHIIPPQPPSRVGRPPVLASSTRNSSVSKAKAFFYELVNLKSLQDDQGKNRSRIIYIRDYPTLAESASTWYPALLHAVRQYRQGPARLGPIANNVTMVFGMTPSLVQPVSPFGSSQGLLGLLNSRREAPVLNVPSKRGKSDFGEDERAEKARERRLRERLRKWERNEHALLDETPKLPQTTENGLVVSERNDAVFFGGNSPMASPPQGSSTLFSALRNLVGREDSGNIAPFFRTAILVPSVRNHGMERVCRVARRREINELTIRMAIGSIGGELDPRPDFSKLLSTPFRDQPTESDTNNTQTPTTNGVGAEPEPSKEYLMWNEWGNRVETWVDVKDIADRAVGSVVAENIDTFKTSPHSTPVPWSAVIEAWAARSLARAIRKAWLQESSRKVRQDHPEDANEQEGTSQHDDVIQRLREDNELTPHQQRLLSCIVDASSMPTSFNQVHLPAHTIDSIRTVVSLPLIYPSAFQQGILKQHSMTGCLLFGPPGTGKTLVVRALAKEAGCRMLAVQPSDVMDMYVGEGEKLVRSLFELARRLSPCVIFLDEIDALFGSRSSSRDTGGALAHHGVITEFMQEMDGLRSNRDSNVIVIGATNRPFDLDDAILRRLPRRLLVDLPGEKEREEILKILLRDEQLASDVDLTSLAKRTEFFSGSDLKHLCVSAALDAVKEGVVLPWTVPKENVASEIDTAKTEENGPSDSQPTMQSEVSASSEPEDSKTQKTQDEIPDSTSSEEFSAPRVLYNRHFMKALKEITPSSSESLGSLAELRKWNDEFGEGQRRSKRKVMWGKGFGFAEPSTETPADGHVSSSPNP